MGAAVLLSTGIARIVMYVCAGRTARGVALVGRVAGSVGTVRLSLLVASGAVVDGAF